MRRTRMMLAAAAVAVSLSAAGPGVALAQEEDPDLAEQCASYNFFEWLFFHHECHGHGGGTVYWPSF
jgi:hypothetical protein